MNYTKEELDKLDIIEKKYFSNEDPQAKQKRDKQARELRKQGYTVQTQTFYFDHIGYAYILTAQKPKQVNDNKQTKLA